MADVFFGTTDFDEKGEWNGGPFFAIAILLLLVPFVSATVRRLHDIDRPGGWFFIQMIPLVGPIVLLVWTCTKGTEGENRFGADPTSDATAAVFD